MDTEIAVRAVARDRPSALVLVVDASRTERTAALCDELAKALPGLRLHHLTASRPGLARQRNEALEWCLETDVDIMHFIDDDTEILPGYLDAIEQRLSDEPELAGAGGVIENRVVQRHRRLKSLFLLDGSRPSTVLRSGRPVMGQFPDSLYTGRVEWLNGCSMSYRTAVVAKYRFDDELTGYSLGEDYDFGWRVSRSEALAVEGSAHCLHHLSSENRRDAGRHGFERTVLTYTWASMHFGEGVSKPAFWWSAVGDTYLRLGDAILQSDGARLREAWGIVRGLFAILTGRASRTLG